VEQVMTLRQIYEWAVVTIPLSTALLNHSKETMMLEKRFWKPRRILGAQKMHCVIPASKNQVQTKVFSEANVFNTTQTVHLQHEKHQAEDRRWFVT
jgi:hypothetical protein